ncbi:YtfJ family protein [Chimaeribacter arupi]|uniref:YtfJ family protein n=1 Tax=Chimaeribacter arupi TaxID=2060066 RepID=UPI000C7B781D|nr:YtfJ family protein [Chimaeribacter arupi]PLR45810.1 YtfJ family protein [Chimaeribacter arupi]PLR52958.1 YtfJ family protein [Chimaeribacter arupi]
MFKHSLLTIVLMASSFIASAHNFTIMQPVPPVYVSDKGELLLNHGTFSYQRWQSAALAGKVRVIQHIAGRTAAKEINAPLVEAIKAANLPAKYYQTTTIVNSDDAIIGTGAFVRSSIKESKESFPWSQFVVDDQGVVRKAWALKEASSAIVVLDTAGKVRFAKEGALTAAEVQQVIALLHQLIPAA